MRKRLAGRCAGSEGDIGGTAYRVDREETTEMMSMDDASHYSLSRAVLPSLGARTDKRAKLRRFILSPFDCWYRWAGRLYLCHMRIPLLILRYNKLVQALGDISSASGILYGLGFSLRVRIPREAARTSRDH